MEDFVQALASIVAALSPANMLLIVTFLAVCSVLVAAQKSGKIEFADLIIGNGKSASATKLLNLIGGITATWIVVTMADKDTLTMDIFLVYLTYVAGIQGFSKFVAAKYNYSEGTTTQSDQGNQ